MGIQQLQKKTGSGVVTIPKAELRADDLLDDDGQIPSDQNVSVDKLGRRAYLIRFPEDDGGSLPELSECAKIRRLAAEIALSRDPEIRDQPAD
jgi:hypothetical protein